MSIDLSQFYKLFFEETAEHLAEMETLLLALDVTEPAKDDLNAIFRAAHSIFVVGDLLYIFLGKRGPE